MAGAEVRRFVWRNTPAPARAGAVRGVAGRSVAVIGGTAESARAVSTGLASYGARLWRSGGPNTPDAIVDLTLAEPFDPSLTDAADAALRETLTVLRHCYEDWSGETDGQRIAYLAVTYLGGHSGYGSTPMHQPLGGIWAGLAKTLHREIPTLRTRVVDVPDPGVAELPEIVGAELYADGPAEVGYLGGVRQVLVPRPQAVSGQAVNLGTDDIVLVVGGGTGIGFELARALARRYGCRVVATGRAQPPTGTEDWAQLDADGFDRHRRELLRIAAANGTLRAARGEIDRQGRLRALHANLLAVRAEGLPIRYVSCDHANPEQLATLIDNLGATLSGVVFIAGVDRPARLPAKTDEQFLAGVAVKVAGFLRVFGAVRGRKLKFFCNAGSLTGRLGGMVGELDYAAGNEGLARLGLWARQWGGGGNVFTVCWPLWQGLSVSSNVDAALRYMPAMEPGDGIDRWCAELLATGDGEVAFLAAVDSGLSLTQAGQFITEPALPGFDRVYPRVFHRGEPLYWQPGRRLTCRVRFTSRDAPVIGDVLVDDVPALPVTLLLDNALRSAEWLVSSNIVELTDIWVDRTQLRVVDDVLELERDTVLNGGHRKITVLIRTPGDDVPIARMTARSADRFAEQPTPTVPGHGATPAPVPSAAMRWRGAIIPTAHWRRHSCGTRTAEVSRCLPSDLWAAEPAPESRLPVAAVENIVRMACAGEGRDPLRIAAISLGSAPRRADFLIGDRDGETWYAIDSTRPRVVATVRIPTASGEGDRVMRAGR